MNYPTRILPVVDLNKLKASCRQHEGTGPVENGAFLPYKDSLGNPTIGYGHLIANGISAAASEQILTDDCNAAVTEISAYSWWHAVSAGPEPRARALAELYFELGHARFNGFVHALAAVDAGDWNAAADGFQNSRWFQQVKTRGPPMVAAIRTGADY